MFLTIKSISRKQLWVSVTNNTVYLGGQKLGERYSRVKYPAKVEVFTFTTSTGREYVVASHTIPFLTRWCGKRQFQTRAHLHGVSLSFRHMKYLKVGMVVGLRTKFHLMRGWMTDNVIRLPLYKPARMQRGLGGLGGIHSQDWLTLLRALSGLRFEEGLFTSPRARKLVKAERGRVEQKARAEAIKGKCFNGQNCDLVAVGSNLLFTGTWNDRSLYVVDSPKYGRALYAFAKRDDAKAWAERRCTAEEARRRALARIVHLDDWEERVELALLQSG